MRPQKTPKKVQQPQNTFFLSRGTLKGPHRAPIGPYGPHRAPIGPYGALKGRGRGEGEGEGEEWEMERERERER